MSVAPLKLFHLVAPNPEGTVYTSPGGVVLRKLHVVNTSAGAAAVSVSVAGFRVLAAKTIAANDFLPGGLVIGVPLDAGQTVTAFSSVAGALTLIATGWSF